jgi:hypothetical protein
MLETTDPPSVERKSVERWEKVRGFARKLVSRETIIAAIRVLQLLVRIVTLIKELFGGF